MTSLEALVALLEAEHAAVWAYGLLGARLPAAEREPALAAHTEHRRNRDALVALVGERGAPLPTPATAYDVRVATPSEARALALRLEDGLAARWHDLIGATSEAGLRRLGVAGLQGCATRAARWRALAGVTPATVPFPGRG